VRTQRGPLVAEKLTDRLAKTLPAPRRGNRITYDLDVKGFGLRVTVGGHRSFILNYRRKADGIERRWTIGSFPDWSVGAARDEAKRLKRSIDGGADPVGNVHSSRAGATVAELCARFERDVLPRNRASTQASYRQQIKADILPALGRMKVAAVTYSDIDALHSRIGARAPTHANRVVALLSRLLSLAMRWGLRTDNPCRGVERATEHRRQRYLNVAELARLSTALANLPDQSALRPRTERCCI
jgi:Arm DNA-binding domain/Phage integrase central domain